MNQNTRPYQSSAGPQCNAEPSSFFSNLQRIGLIAKQASLSLLAAAAGLAIADGTPIHTPLGSIVGQAAIAQPAPAQPRIRWTPNKERGNAKGTLSGGRRGQASAACGSEASATRLTLLVPEGRENLLTTATQPTLSWQVATQQPTTMQFILSDPKRPTPIYTQTLNAATTGIQSVRLPSTVVLTDETDYRWTVLVNCPSGQKTEIYARSFIRKTSRAFLEQQLSQKSAVAQAQIFAENGIWYDAVGQLLQEMLREKRQEKRQTQPSGDPMSSAVLSALLSQAVPDGAQIQVRP